MEWKHLNRLPVCFVLFLPLFCLFFYLFCFSIWHTFCFYHCFLYKTPSYSTSFVQSWNSFVFPFPRPPSLADWRPFLWLGLVEEWRTFFFFFLIKQFRKISQVRFRGDSGIYKQASAYTVISVALKQRSTPNHKNHVWTRQRRKGPRKGRRQTSSQGVAW